MNRTALAREIRERSRRLRYAEEMPSTRGQLADDGELLLVLARIIDGQPVEKAFGAPGDWGYSHPIGKALAANNVDQNAEVQR